MFLLLILFVAALLYLSHKKAIIKEITRYNFGFLFYNLGKIDKATKFLGLMEETATNRRPHTSFQENDMMTQNQFEWSRKHDELVAAITQLGFPEALGSQIAKQLGSPKAMDSMLAYLYNVKPRTAELVVDEMLAICSDIDAWHNKKAAEEANAKYNEMLYYGLGTEEEP